ncbi:hypothetical protein AC578_1448 [Pseudocercospora eumusae]|uniref:Uncharacterized protein n=1 Tax=Pseudocercospora eumusae TaxID=321146 RepID=A0A139GTK1_9PEZI|nr:hypothetical protein AC578_1448 [Pseudocercospora eumusae]
MQLTFDVFALPFDSRRPDICQQWRERREETKGKPGYVTQSTKEDTNGNTKYTELSSNAGESKQIQASQLRTAPNIDQEKAADTTTSSKDDDSATLAAGSEKPKAVPENHVPAETKDTMDQSRAIEQS